MYSPSIIDRNVRKIERQLKVKLKRYSIDECIGRKEEICALQDDKGRLVRPLNSDEQEFIRNEQILSKLDARHFIERYVIINLDASLSGEAGVGTLRLHEPQKWLFQKISEREEKCYGQRDRNEPIDGILVACNKIRQIGFTAVWRAILFHRFVMWDNTRMFSASLNSDLVSELYDRDQMIYTHLPFFLKPAMKYDVKDTSFQLQNGSRLIYQESTQKGAFGISRQFDAFHMTEVSQWDKDNSGPTDRIKLDFLPSIPQAITTIGGLESVPFGRGNFWHEFTEQVRKGLHPRWLYTFIPWYAEPRKYRRQPPVDWEPTEDAMLHAKKVSETCHMYTKWTNYMVPKDNLYWWESSREEYRIQGELNYFLTNYAATPEESFQHANRSAFSAEFLERVRNTSFQGVPYELDLHERRSLN